MDIVFPGGSRPAIRREQQESKSYSGAVQRHENKGSKITRSQYSIQTIDVLFSSPIINSSDFSIKSGISDRTAQRIIQRMEQDGILRMIRDGRGSRSPTYLFLDLLDITENEGE
jgi:Fic family protein